MSRGRTVLMPTQTGRAFLSWEPAPSLALCNEAENRASLTPSDLEDFTHAKDRSEEFALYHFMSLIVNPEWELLLGDQCKRCGRYILKKARRPKLYCSRKCGAAVTAVEATRKRRRAEYNENISKAVAACNEWHEKPKPGDWKKWVSQRTKLSPKWISRAVNKGHLLPPTPSPGGQLVTRAPLRKPASNAKQ